jgi:hypothetical protein
MTSIIKVNNLQNQCGANIISESSNVITIGASGDTVTLAAGASQSGFGRSGSVNWDTTPKTSSPVTAVSGNGYFINTTSIAITVNLPAGVAGSIVAISDYANTAATNNITIDPNGTDKINGVNQDAKITTNGAAITLVYVDATRGWKDVNDATLDVTGIPPFVAATGGTITTSGCGNFKIHTFTGPGTFTVTNSGTPAGSNTVEYLVVAGGGAGGNNLSGGGGAGGFRNNFPSPTTAGLPVSATAYPITVGAGGAVRSSPPQGPGGSGNNSIFSTITSAGGGGGGGGNAGPGCFVSGNGGSGGGGNGYAPAPTAGGTGNTPPVSPPQGNNGGSGGGGGPNYPGGGGGGSAAVGGRNPTGSGTGSAGGAGTQLNIDGNNYYWAGGGGGGQYDQGGTAGAGGIGGGGGGGTCTPGTGGTGGGSAINSGANGLAGSPAGPGAVVAGGAGGANSGGGGGGAGHASSTGLGGSGGSGIVVIRYKFQ